MSRAVSIRRLQLISQLALPGRDKHMHEASRRWINNGSHVIPPFVVHPATLAYQLLCKTQDTSLFGQLNEASLQLNRRRWLDVMECPDAESLVDAQRTLQTFADDLDALLPKITALHEAIFHAELADLIGPMELGGKTIWQTDFESVYAHLAETVDSYGEYVDDAVSGMKPFLDLK